MYRPVFVVQNLSFVLRFARCFGIVVDVLRARRQTERENKRTKWIAFGEPMRLCGYSVRIRAYGLVCGSESCSFTVGCTHLFVWIVCMLELKCTGVHVYQSYCLFSVHSLPLRFKRKTTFVSMFILRLALVVLFTVRLARPHWNEISDFLFAFAQLDRCRAYFHFACLLAIPEHWH